MLNPQNTECVFDVVFCDWLDITFPLSSVRLDEMLDYFMSIGFQLHHLKSVKGSHQLHCFLDKNNSSMRGVLDISVVSRYDLLRVSLSGSVLSYLRSVNCFTSTLSFFSEFPHHITRLDSALDADIVSSLRLRYLRDKYPVNCALTSRALSTNWRLSTGIDGKETGTFYVGDTRKSTLATARCYDKRHQLWQTTSCDLGFEVFRYEITSRFKRDRDGATLRDVLDPTSLFYHFASPSLLRKPKDVADWVGGSSFTFSVESPSDVLPSAQLKALIQENYLFQRIAALSRLPGSGGVDYALSLLRQEIERFNQMPL